MIVFPNAKINIGLHIVSKRSDGYHNLETVFFPVPLCDALEMAVTGITDISFSGIPVNCSSGDNLVIKAYRLLREDFGLPPVQFHLHKAIPYGAGLGGGSSDAAFTLKMLNDYFELHLNKESLKKYAEKLGADCPFFIENIPVYAEGKGEKLFPISLNLSDYIIVILKPSVFVSTREAYSNAEHAKPLFDLINLGLLPVEKWGKMVFNDFEKIIFSMYPEIAKWKQILYENGALYAGMSGSGSAVYGIFKVLPENFHDKIPKNVLLMPYFDNFGFAF
jgi:4-diphosphocytidyl-2-C-methyl-D-erythritol kinase